MARISILLTTYDTGFTEEDEWTAWVTYVQARLDAIVGEDVDVDSVSWRGRRNATGKDQIRFAPRVPPRVCDLLEGLVRSSIATLWDDWCAEGAPAAAEPDPETAYLVYACNVRPTAAGPAGGVDLDVSIEIERGQPPIDGFVTLMPRADGRNVYVRHGRAANFWISPAMMDLLRARLSGADLERALECIEDAAGEAYATGEVYDPEEDAAAEAECATEAD